jgi:hypothetical protein
MTGSAAWRAITRSTSPGSHCRTSPKMPSSRAQVIPGSKRSIIASYFDSPVCSDSSEASSRASARTSRKLARKPVQSLAGRWRRHACSQRLLASRCFCTSFSGSALDSCHARRISRRLARCTTSRSSCSARSSRSRSAGSVRMRCSSAAISASAAARASTPLGGMLAAWSQPAIDIRWPKRCIRVQVDARSS